MSTNIRIIFSQGSRTTSKNFPNYVLVFQNKWQQQQHLEKLAIRALRIYNSDCHTTASNSSSNKTIILIVLLLVEILIISKNYFSKSWIKWLKWVNLQEKIYSETLWLNCIPLLYWLIIFFKLAVWNPWGYEKDASVSIVQKTKFPTIIKRCLHYWITVYSVEVAWLLSET